MKEVVLFNSYMSVEQTVRLRDAGFRVLLLNVSEDELRWRNDVRFVEEGWSNIEWLGWHQSVIQELQDSDLFDDVISGEQEIESVADDIVRLAEKRPPDPN